MFTNLRVDSERSKEGAGIFDMSVLRSNEHTEACDADERNKDVDETSLLCSVGDISDHDCEDGSTGVWRNGQQVCCGAAVSGVRWMMVGKNSEKAPVHHLLPCR